MSGTPASDHETPRFEICFWNESAPFGPMASSAASAGAAHASAATTQASTTATQPRIRPVSSIAARLSSTPAVPAARVRSDLRDVDGLRPLVAGFLVVGHLRAFRERLEARRVDARVMDEQVLPTLIGGNEAEALFVVEP